MEIQHDRDSHSPEHILPLKIYLGVGGALLVLTAITVWVAQFQFGEWNTIVAMTIAGVKAILVAFFFMHLFYDNKLYFMVFAGSLAFLAIFIILTMYDTERRGDVYDFKARLIEPNAIIYQNPDIDAPKPHEDPGVAPDTVKEAIPASVDPTNNPADTVKGNGH